MKKLKTTVEKQLIFVPDGVIGIDMPRFVVATGGVDIPTLELREVIKEKKLAGFAFAYRYFLVIPSFVGPLVYILR